MKYALITGGATGLGRGFSNALSDLGYNLIITSRNYNNLINAKKEIELKYSNKVQIFVADLTDENSRKNLFEYTKFYNVEVLINNAGAGYSEEFLKGFEDKEKKIINLNVSASHFIFKHYYELFCEKENSRIINVSSLASFVPTPYAATYSASKAYLTSLSLAVAEEAKEYNVIVQTLAPTSIKTDFHKTAGTKAKSYKGNPNKIARLAIESKKKLILPGFKAKLYYFLIKVLPRGLMIKIVSRRQKNKKED